MLTDTDQWGGQLFRLFKPHQHPFSNSSLKENKFLQTKATDLSTYRLQQKIKQWRSAWPRVRWHLRSRTSKRTDELSLVFQEGGLSIYFFIYIYINTYILHWNMFINTLKHSYFHTQIKKVVCIQTICSSYMRTNLKIKLIPLCNDNIQVKHRLENIRWVYLIYW